MRSLEDDARTTVLADIEMLRKWSVCEVVEGLVVVLYICNNIVLCLRCLFCRPSDLNGAQGSWTNTDDIDRGDRPRKHALMHYGSNGRVPPPPGGYRPTVVVTAPPAGAAAIHLPEVLKCERSILDDSPPPGFPPLPLPVPSAPPMIVNFDDHERDMIDRLLAMLDSPAESVHDDALSWSFDESLSTWCGIDDDYDPAMDLFSDVLSISDEADWMSVASTEGVCVTEMAVFNDVDDLSVLSILTVSDSTFDTPEGDEDDEIEDLNPRESLLVRFRAVKDLEVCYIFEHCAQDFLPNTWSSWCYSKWCSNQRITRGADTNVTARATELLSLPGPLSHLYTILNLQAATRISTVQEVRYDEYLSLNATQRKIYDFCVTKFDTYRVAYRSQRLYDYIFNRYLQCDTSRSTIFNTVVGAVREIDEAKDLPPFIFLDTIRSALQTIQVERESSMRCIRARPAIHDRQPDGVY